MQERLTFEKELEALDIFQGKSSAEIGGYWVSLGDSSVVRIVLIDPSGVFTRKTSLREKLRFKLETKFNTLDSDWLKQMGFAFRVEYTSSEPSKQQKADFGKLDFPVYLLAKQHSFKTVRTLLEQHQIPRDIDGTDIYKKAEEGWQAKDVRGIGIPSGKGHRKVGFIKTYRVFDDATRDLALAFANVIGHEIGHMGNRKQHSNTGLMKYPVSLSTELDFSTNDKYLFLNDLLRLRKLN